MDTTEKVILTIGIVLTVAMAGLVGFESGQHGVRKEALLLGHAQYVADADGNPKFTWKK